MQDGGKLMDGLKYAGRALDQFVLSSTTMSSVSWALSTFFYKKERKRTILCLQT